MATILKTTAADAAGTTAANDIIVIPSIAGIGGAINGLAGLDEIRFDDAAPATLDLSAFSALTSIEAVTLGTGIAAAADTSGTLGHSIIASSYAANALLLTGNAGDNAITGTGNADTLVGGGGADTISGGGGNDLFLIASADHGWGDVVLGGGGTDEIRFTSTAVDGEALFLDADSDFELVVIGAGTLAHSVIAASTMLASIGMTGNAGDNVLVAGGGNDTLLGGAGGDLLVGGDGDDRLDGGAGEDTADGEEGADTYVVSVAADFTAADSLADSGIDGATDTLELRLASGVFLVGANVIGIEAINVAGATATSAAGVAIDAANTDSFAITGNAAANTLTGGAGDDTLAGGLGIDSLSGGAGNDVFLVASIAEGTGDKYSGGIGVDTVRFAPTVAPAAGVNLFVIAATPAGIERFEIAGAQAYGINAAALLAANAASLAGNAAANALTGGAGHDTLEGGGGADLLRGGAGNDVFVIGLAAAYAGDTIIGDAGVDTIRFDAALGEMLVLSGAAGALSVEAVVIAGGVDAGVNASAVAAVGLAISGDDSENLITGSKRADTISGGGGNDTVLVQVGSNAVSDRVHGGEGDDQVLFTSTSARDTLTIRATTGVEAWLVSDASGDRGGTTSLNVNAAAATSAVAVYGNDGINSLIGSPYGDMLDGAAGNDVLDGRGGADSLAGGAGRDKLLGGGGNDSLAGGADNDTLAGGAGNDTLSGGGGNDRLDGGSGIDLVDFSTEVAGGIIDLSLQSVVLGATTDTLISIEWIVGSAGDNSMTGTAGAELLDGSAGNDTLDGGLGNDTLIGGAGIDLVNYAGGAAVTVNLTTGTSSSASTGMDTLASIENVIGTAFADSITGGASANKFTGGAGNDTLNGAGGTDTADYGGEGAAVTVNLTTGTASGASMGTDTLISIERVIGTGFDDSITGTSGFNNLNGGAGNDTLDGADGNGDTADYSLESAAVTVNLMTGTASGASTGTDTLISIEQVIGTGFDDSIMGANGTSTIKRLTGGAGNDTLVGGADYDNLTGGAGNDSLDGGAGIDYADYSVDFFFAVTVNLGTGTASGAGSGSDTLAGIEGVFGTNLNDVIIGDSGANDLFGEDGNDSLDGAAGNDVLSDFLGNDTLEGGAGNDILAGGAGADIVSGGDGDDGLFASAGDGDDSLDGGADTDTLAYLTDETDAIAVDLDSGIASGAAGNDTLSSIENVDGANGNDTLMGSSEGNFLTGFGGDDSMDGRAGIDQLDGGEGHDTLAGGAGSDNLFGGNGNDLFVFDQAPAGVFDVIGDFVSGNDRFELDNSFFAGTLAASSGGVLNAAAFRAASDLSSGGAAGQYILYDTDSGELYYDANADGVASDATQFALLNNNPAIVASDFLVIA